MKKPAIELDKVITISPENPVMYQKKFSVLKFFSLSLLILFFLITDNIFPQDIKLVNGNWFTGKDFAKKDVRIENGKLSFKTKKTDSGKTIDLGGKYIIPPFAEAHNHNLESAYEIDERIANYFSHGVFYVKIQSSIKKRIRPLMDKYNHPGGLDISQAYAPITGTDGHPIGIRKWYLEKGFFGGLFKTIEEIESHGYFTIDNEKQLTEKWPSVLSTKPDFIKVMLIYSEEYGKRKGDKKYFGKKGLNPKLLPDIIKKAHKEDLRVSVHVATPADFRQAIKSGADEIAHLPGYSNGLKITSEDAQLAAQKDVFVVTTAALVKRRNKAPNYPELIEGVKHNLRLLKDAGVKLAVGSDMYNDTSLEEVTFLAGLDIFSNLELLKIWTENTAETIFPARKIGKLAEGYEASFLVLSGDPIRDFGNTQKIEMRMKQGKILK